MIALLLCLIAAPPHVGYAVNIEMKTWQPLETSAVDKMIENSALPPLQGMRLERVGFADLDQAEYTLLLEGRSIEEAEQFSVYLTFGPGKANALPSFYVAETDNLGHQSATDMQKTIERLAKRAGERLAKILNPLVAGASIDVPGVGEPETDMPTDWGMVPMPNVASPSAIMKTLLDVRNPDGERFRALAQLEGHVFDQPAVAGTVSLCAVRDPSPELRGRCVDALAPVARTRVNVQRLLLQSMRREVDDHVLASIGKLASSFVGLSRKEAIETWLELISDNATPGSAASNVAELLSGEGDVPNLDLAIGRCLGLDAIAYGKKVACAELLRNVAPARRPAIVWNYLRTVSGYGETNTWNEIKSQVFNHDKIDAASADLFFSVATRRSAGHLRHDAIYLASHHPHPTLQHVETFLRLATEPMIAWTALRGINELVRTDPSLRPAALAAVEKFAVGRHYAAGNQHGDPDGELRHLLERLRKAE